jgi:hypothetical protein
VVQCRIAQRFRLPIFNPQEFDSSDFSQNLGLARDLQRYMQRTGCLVLLVRTQLRNVINRVSAPVTVVKASMNVLCKKKERNGLRPTDRHLVGYSSEEARLLYIEAAGK